VTEKRLITLAKNGKPRAFKALYENNVTQLYSFMSQFSSDFDVIEDWVQRAFIKAFNKIKQFNGTSKFSTWLFRIAINEMKSDFIKFGKITFSELDDLNEDTTFSNTTMQIDTLHDTKIILSQLDELKRAVFLLIEVEGYSHRETSDILQISEAYSRTTLHRTKKILQEKILAMGL
jgi:RNA polymerase sigma factor (sigma-70 family)